ncbi:MAG: hypothetical protein CMJ25_07510 [Phycisphaerae bacterium]|nr:hypothetical protein [Phycisphaerae bacterium]
MPFLQLLTLKVLILMRFAMLFANLQKYHKNYHFLFSISKLFLHCLQLLEDNRYKILIQQNL